MRTISKKIPLKAIITGYKKQPQGRPMNRSYRWWTGEGKENASHPPHPRPLHHTQPLPSTVCTSTGFLRLLRSLAILAFLSCFRFFSSRSLSPSLLEELAEALLSNLPESKPGLDLRREDRTPWPQGRRKTNPKIPTQKGQGKKTRGQDPPPIPNTASSHSLRWLQPCPLQTQPQQWVT